jgi:hypothetical protein
MSTPKQKPSALRDDDKSAKVAARVSRLSWFLDESIRLPGGFRIGWDGIIGLIPGLGDLMGLAASSYILYLAAQGGVGKVVLVRMALNILSETVLGSIPVIGDLFDFVFKANSRNLQLLQRYAEAPTRVRRVSAVWLIIFLLLMLLAIAGIVIAVVKLLEWLLLATF